MAEIHRQWVKDRDPGPYGRLGPHPPGAVALRTPGGAGLPSAQQLPGRLGSVAAPQAVDSELAAGGLSRVGPL